ncbi:MAG: tetratricopeptide repeat protein [Gammaproteobacteria bacterium]|nr:tetratricopeptide repeat protein [Gammaproteobacteria bacterium]
MALSRPLLWLPGVAIGLAVTTGVHAASTPEDCRRLGYTDRQAATECYRGLLLDPSPAIQAEALWGLGDWKAANRAFRAAAAAAPKDADVRVRWGLLYLEAHQDADAEVLFQEALELDGAHVDAQVGLAEVAADRFDARARAIANSVLERAPDHPGARFVLARGALTVGDVATGRELVLPVVEADDPGARLGAMALLAAADHLEGDVPSEWTGRALHESPHHGAVFETVAHFYVITRRYEEAVALLERAVEVDPRLYSAHAALGINLLRVNRFDEAQRHLARSFEGDPYDSEVVNTLRMLDSLHRFDLTEDPRLVLRTHQEETGALEGYVRRLVDEAIPSMGARYGHVVEEPVIIELYPHHDDFAVRTSGLPGIGILGATFGDVIAMDSPSARGIDDGFDWASALWHELAHVVTLNATDNLVSRWFSEGVSVLEEWRTGPSRSRSVPLEFVEAAQAGRLLPVERLDGGFMQPDSPGRVALSYVQAGLLCEYMEDTWGVGALARVLAAYADGEDTADAIGRGLELAPAELDAGFEAHLDARFGDVDPDRFRANVQAAQRQLKEEDWSAAVEAARAATKNYPEYVGPASAWPLLAQAQAGAGRMAEATAALTEYWRRGGRAPGTLRRLVEWLESGDRPAEALPVQRSLALVAPLVPEERRRLGDFLVEAGQYEDAILEYQAHLALRPHDRADAHYRLARAYHGADRLAAARRHVLYALEIAPRFGDALALLLEMEG